MPARYQELLSDIDLEVLARADTAGITAEELRGSPGDIERLLDEPAVFDALFDPEQTLPSEPITPLLVFAAIVHRGAAEIGDLTHVPERFGSRLVIPVFDGERLGRFVADPETKTFLVELLGSYTRVMSGPHWERTRGRWRKRRFSEMNPAQLAQLASSVPMEQRAGAYRRLGDLSLFMNGVFPDHVARQTLTPVELERVVRSLPAPGRAEAGRLIEHERIDAVGPVLSALGPRWYGLAAQLVPIPAMRSTLETVSDRFDEARRFLNFVTDRYLWNRRSWLFPLG